MSIKSEILDAPMTPFYEVSSIETPLLTIGIILVIMGVIVARDR